jgi:hypothetical protein
VIRFFIGYDEREAIAYHVLAQSILRLASVPVSITPLVQSHLRKIGLYRREPDLRASTSFSLTRFLVPELCGFKGEAVYMDCDMLCLRDPVPPNCRDEGFDRQFCWQCNRENFSVAVCKHDYVPRLGQKMDGQRNFAYPRKNWSSLMIFNNERCRALTREYVNEATPADLHRFAWVPDDEIRGMPLTNNWLVDEYEPNPSARVLHYTLGGPWFPQWQGDHELEWFREFDSMVSPAIVAVAGRPVGSRRG